MRVMSKEKAVLYFLLGGFALLSTSCHLLIGLEERSLPEKDGSSTECSNDEECDDEQDCTQDRCELSSRVCTYHIKPDGETCRPSEGECDISETCDGTDRDCPPDSFKPATELCRESTDPGGTCDPAEYCTGTSPECPEDSVEPEGKECDDLDDCTYQDACDGSGVCRGENGLYGVVILSAGASGKHACSLLEDDETRCWGSGTFYQLGNGTTESSSFPIPVTGLSEGNEILQISCGGYHTCVLLRTGKIMCWGRNENGQLGNTSGDYSQAPTEVEVEEIGHNWDFVSAGRHHTCAIHRNYGAHCWGRNSSGQLGNGTTDDSSVPSVVELPSRPSRVSAGGTHTCAVLQTGEVQCWGDNASGQVGNGSVAGSTSVPVAVEGLLPGDPAVEVTLGLQHTCALLDSGSVMCWGNNSRCQLGAGDGEGGPAPVAVDLEGAAAAISSGDEHTCVLLKSGGIMCWGAGGSGQLGNGTDNDHSLPVSVTGITELSSGVTEISCGSSYSCALFETGIVYCWGSNDAGQLGNGTNEGSLVPVQVRCE